MRTAALVLVLVLAGCVNPFTAPPPPTGPFDEDEPKERPPTVAPEEGALCGIVSVEPRPVVARIGEPVDVVATLSNCGRTTLSIDRGQCPDEGSGFRMLIRRGLNDFHLHARSDATAAALHDTPCVLGGSSVFGLPPNASYASYVHQVTFRWDGRFASDPCWPATMPNQTVCLEDRPAIPGDYVLRARIVGSGVTWEGNATLRIEGETPESVAVSPCANLTLDVEGMDIAARLENCGGTDLTLDPAKSCNEPYPIAVRVADATVQERGSALRDVGCYAKPRAPIVVLAGQTAVARYAWDGTVRDAGCADCATERLPSGEYQVTAMVSPREGETRQAAATIRIP